MGKKQKSAALEVRVGIGSSDDPEPEISTPMDWAKFQWILDSIENLNITGSSDGLQQ